MDSKHQDKDQEQFYDLQHYWLLVKRRWLPIAVVSSSVLGLAALVTYRQKPVYQAEGKLLFDTNENASKLTDLTDKVVQFGGGGNLSNPLDTQAEVIRSIPIVQKTITDLKLKDGKGEPLEVQSFLGKLNIKSVKNTDVLTVSYKSHNPQEAATVVNSLTRNYLENNIRTKRAQARAAREFLSKQLPLVEERVALAEAEVREFKEKNNVVALEEEAKAGVESLKALSAEITKAQADLTDAKTRHQALQSLLTLNSQQAVTFSNLSQSSGVGQILTEYQKVQDQLAVERTRLTNRHPMIISMLEKQQALKKQLQLRVAEVEGNSQSVSEPNLQLGKLKQTLSEDLVKLDHEELGLGNRLAVFRKEFLLYQQRLRMLPKLEQQQRELERRLQVAQFTYQELQKRFQEVLLQENQTIGNARVITEALMPKNSISPRIQQNLLLGGCLGILLGVGTALMLESLDKSLKTIEEVKRVLDYPLLGSIPRVDEKTKESEGESRQELPVLNNPHSGVTAAFEMLQTNLGFTLSDKTLKVIVVSSAVKGEGKSYVAANLAVAIVQMGRRVLLVDADMRLPRQQQIWQRPNLMGLSHILVGQAELQTTAQEALVNLEVLTAGTVPPNPAALLDSQRMAGLLEEVARDYDFVIIDTPPLNMFPDAMLLSKLADGLLLVVRPGIVDSAAVSTARTLLDQSRSQVLGMVVNGVTGESHYGRYYYKGYYGSKGSDKDRATEGNLINS
ncbi:polysaccharide biosynthesis tyrosine autokinase [Aetokthonos hydrillicola Thurmond2011]|jgi:capsular exopolysaccharide synthesis family protein|uniref:non-specific protein-tyrosine kinase n=1 Tax=Aetokthonos hydrillicola Thurmond2011 TaxID=2712845 RepID=A0AAP5MC81_9CYAN|nr:polysaccharide biosynthesis tyrosine autokinase [Aetokthonos hydrillicola]MBO3460277.1 polysaccharide biosynthesis tyrosine autokinase [Aetokthonos hydrillicola CCALA 1050]MBW4587625.1 polysaccharide biosynthesis tyrosine autokinase [Aetokthonos hydrillicola CCALA 1050]MDR9897993.1 polysaccharide biosynthesis tyrosine autokinase [Aetokthonos hydrillicola Thurmond2011]